MKICLMLKLLSKIPPHNTRYDGVYAPASKLYSQKMISLGSRLIACCKLAPTLARQMWLHNYVIDRNEYLIFTLSESISPWVYSLQFLFKSTNNSWRYERKCVCFFSELSVYDVNIYTGHQIFPQGQFVLPVRMPRTLQPILHWISNKMQVKNA